MATLEEIRRELIRRGAIEPTPIGTAALRSAGDALTLGFGDELRGGLEYISAVNRGASGEEATQLRDRATEASRRRLEEARTDRPWTTGGVGVAASLIPYTGAARLARMGLGAGRLARTIQAAPAASRTRALSRLTARNQAAPPQALAAVGAQGEAVGHRLAARLAPRLHRANRQALYGSSAGVGALYGAGAGQTPEERLIGAGVGAGAGLGGAAVGEALGNITAAVTRRGLDPQARALRMIDRARREKQPTEQDLMRRLVRGGMSPSRARSEARRMIQAGEGGEMSLADIRNRARAAHSRPTTPSMLQVLSDKRLARAIHSVGGRGAAIMDQALDAQQGSLGRDVATQLERTFRPRGTRAPGARGRGRSRGQGGGIDNQPPPTGLQELNERLTVAQRAQNRDAYDIAYRATLTPEAQQAAARRMTGGTFKERARQSAIDRAEEDMARVADDLDNAQTTGASAAEIQRLTNELADTVRARQALTSLGGDSPNPALLNTRAIDLYQRGLRHLADDAGGAAKEAGRNIAAVRSTFIENMRSVSPELHQAIGTARGFFGLKEARDLGRSILRPGKQDEVDQLLRRSMTTDEQDAFLIGALDAIEAKLGANELSFVRQLQRNQNWRDLVMRSARSRSAGERLLQTIDDKVAERDLISYVREGSQTTPRAQDVARYSDEGELISLQEALGSGDLKSSLLRVALEQANKIPVVGHRGVRDPAVGAELARILTQPGTRQNAALLAQRLRAAPKTSALTPEGQATSRGAGLFGSGVATQAATRFPEEAAELTGVAGFERAGQALGEGDYLRAGGEGILAGLAAVPLTRPASPLVRGLAAGLGVTALGTGVAEARKGRESGSSDLPSWADNAGFQRHGDYIVSPPSNDDPEFGGSAPRRTQMVREGIDGPYEVYVGTTPTTRDRRYLYERREGEDDMRYVGRIISMPPQTMAGEVPEEFRAGRGGATEGVAGGIAGNLGARALTRLLAARVPVLRGLQSMPAEEAAAFSGGAGGGALAAEATGGRGDVGAAHGVLASTALLGGRILTKADWRNPLRPRYSGGPPRTWDTRTAPVPPSASRAEQGRAIQSEMRRRRDLDRVARGETSLDELPAPAAHGPLALPAPSRERLGRLASLASLAGRRRQPLAGPAPRSRPSPAPRPRRALKPPSASAQLSRVLIDLGQDVPDNIQTLPQLRRAVRDAIQRSGRSEDEIRAILERHGVALQRGSPRAQREVLNWLGNDRLIRNPTDADLARLAELGDELKYVSDTRGNRYVFSASDAHHNNAMRALRDNGVEVESLGPGAEITNPNAAGFIFREPDGRFVHADANARDTGSWADFLQRTRPAPPRPSR